MAFIVVFGVVETRSRELDLVLKAVPLPTDQVFKTNKGPRYEDVVEASTISTNEGSDPQSTTPTVVSSDLLLSFLASTITDMEEF